ncbi:MAG: T9SS type A sorting domain-containing protein, partial [Ignavibacterium sp.]|nr:T9SS type A sorting domain-containing protein [Ignavibacterium sp.]
TDPRKMYTLQQFETNISSDIQAEGGGGTLKPGLKSFITTRIASVQSQLSALGITSASNNRTVTPIKCILSQNYPNPFNPSTTIEFSIASKERVTLSIYNLLGELVETLINEELEAGVYRINFNGSNLTSGIYVYHIHAGNFSASKKMVLVK